jgi:predicted component of type VI protein secretion system
MIAGENEWEIEIAFYTNKRGIDPERARILTIFRWMYHGDFRPLASAIWEGHVLDEAVLNLLAQMIDEDRLKLVPRKGRGRPKAPETLARNVVAALAYETAQRPGKEAFEEIASALGTSEQTVRQAVTAWRKAERKIKSTHN